MCIIIVKPQGVKLPSDNLLRRAAACNRDGFGFMTEDGVVYHSMNIDLFLAVLHRCESKDKAVAIHFRMATHGSVSLKNCHPFNYRNEIIMMHNGVLPIESKNDMTDSEIYLHKVGEKVLRGGLTSPAAAKAFNVSGSRFAVCDVRTRRIAMYGDFTPIKGVYFSNLRPFYAGGLVVNNGRLDYQKSEKFDFDYSTMFF